MKRLSLNRNQLKYLVIVAMLIDHIAWAFVPMNTALGQVMHFIGRLTGPTMAYFVGEGYRYTRDVGRYQKRLGIFAVISWIPFVWFEYGELPFYYAQGEITVHLAQSVIFTLFLGLTAIRLWESGLKKGVRVVGVILLCMVSCVGDWAVMDVLGCLFVHVYRDRPRAKWTAFSLTFLLPQFLIVIANCMSGSMAMCFQLGVALVPLMLYFFYNGEGGSRRAVHKWFFYIFYPAHLLVLGLLRWCVLAV
ncbi:MAG: conjugal transfer protein TraX [Roseburia sp.]|nr:conjugal transfer protein TraX [Roseburia sp.]